MGSMVAHDYQLPSYRHILLEGAERVRLYHFNPEHSVANANAEFHSNVCADLGADAHAHHGPGAFSYTAADSHAQF